MISEQDSLSVIFLTLVIVLALSHSSSEHRRKVGKVDCQTKDDLSDHADLEEQEAHTSE